MSDQNTTSSATGSATPAAVNTPATQAVVAKPVDTVIATPTATTDAVVDKPDAQSAPKTDEITTVIAKVVPEKYELKIPDGSQLDPKRLETISAFAKQKGLSNDEAQAVLQSEHEAIQAHVGLQQESLKQKSQQWLTEAKADKELGGDKFVENIEIAKRALDHLFPDAGIKEFLNTTGLGNHPAILKGFLQMGRRLQNDKIISAPNAQPAAKPNTLANWYDNPTSPKS